MQKLIVLDTETTGRSTNDGDRIIEIGCVEIVDRIITNNEYQQYTKPNKSVGESFQVHEISDEFLNDKPPFAEIVDEFLDFVSGQTLVIHNAAFDIGFLDYELSLLGRDTKMSDICEVIDTLEISKKQNPSARHSLDAICRRYNIDTSKRVKHGALLDAQILAEAYLALTGGQFDIFNHESETTNTTTNLKKFSEKIPTPVIYASDSECLAHDNYFA
jgi:DNA polymerase-3 subunit epsilon